MVMMSETPAVMAKTPPPSFKFERSVPPASWDETSLLKGLSESERLMFQTEYQPVKKSSTTAVVLALFLGGIGAHRFYMGQIGRGVLYCVLAGLAVITIIPISVVVAVVDCFLMPGRVRAFNKAKAEAIALKLKALSPSSGAAETAGSS